MKNVPHEFVTTVVGANDEWSNVSVSPSDVTYAEWSNLEANTQNTYTLTYTQTSNVVYDTKYTLTTTANVTESDSWDQVYVDPPTVTYAEWSNLEANTQNTYTLTFTQTTTDEKTPEEWSALESIQSLYNKVYYQSVEEEVAADYPGAVAHTRSLTESKTNSMNMGRSNGKTILQKRRRRTRFGTWTLQVLKQMKQTRYTSQPLWGARIIVVET